MLAHARSQIIDTPLEERHFQYSANRAVGKRVLMSFNVPCRPPSFTTTSRYLVDEKQFAEERVAKAIERLKKCKGKQAQNRLEDFFGKATVIPAQKRKQPEKKGAKGAASKKGKK